MIPQEIKNLANRIGVFYLNRNNGDYQAARVEIERVRIDNLEIGSDGKVTITTSRPGLLIGKRGETIEALKEYLGCPLHIKETPDHILNYLIPTEPYEEEFDDLSNLYQGLDEEDDLSCYGPEGDYETP